MSSIKVREAHREPCIKARYLKMSLLSPKMVKGGFQITVGLKKRLKMVEFNKRHTQDYYYHSKRTFSDPRKHLLDVLETIST